MKGFIELTEVIVHEATEADGEIPAQPEFVFRQPHTIALSDLLDFRPFDPGEARRNPHAKCWLTRFSSPMRFETYRQGYAVEEDYEEIKRRITAATWTA